MRDPEFIELRNRFLFGLLISIFIGGLLFLFFYRSYKVQGNDIYKSINKDKVIVFVEDNNCSKCVEVHHLLDTNKYKYVLEIHFNSSFNHRISGSCSVVLEGSDVLDIDDELVKDIVDITGNDALEKQELDAFNLKFFKKLGVDMSYLEVEFYDNNEAMKVFKSNQNVIAKKIANSIKKYYG